MESFHQKNPVLGGINVDIISGGELLVLVQNAAVCGDEVNVLVDHHED